MRSRPRVVATVVAIAVLAGGCSDHRTHRTGELPRLSALEIRSTLVSNDDFIPSSIAALSDCSFLVAGSSWGTIVRVSAGGGLPYETAVLPGNVHFARFANTADDQVVFWGSEPDTWGLLDTRTLHARLMPAIDHEWGGHWVGPAARLGTGRFVLAPLGATGPPRRRRLRGSEPLVYVLDSLGNPRAERGQVSDRRGQYLSWLASRITLGSVGDTILTANMADGTLTAYSGDTSTERRDPLWQVALPRYFEPPTTIEEVRRLPWIQIGDLHKFVDVPQIDIASFGSDGKLYAIRNTEAAWQAGRDLVFALQGEWQVTARHLEIYDRHGRRLGSYALPPETISGIRADGYGRIFLVGTKSILIANDPTVQGTACSSPAGRIPFTAIDQPPLTKNPRIAATAHGG